MKYTISQWYEKLCKERVKETLSMQDLLENIHKTLITIKNQGFWTQEELNEALKNDGLYQSYQN